MRYRDVYPNRDPRAGVDREKWQRLRDRVIRREPICRQCGRRASVEVHHIEPVVRRPDLALAWKNCLPCCRECHQRLDRGVVKPKREPPPRPDSDFAC